MQQAIENELSLKSQMDDDQQRFKDVDQALDGDREELRQERDALELMRIDFEQELHQARQEVAKSQDALKTAEDRVRSAEMIERQKLIAGMYPRAMVCCMAWLESCMYNVALWAENIDAADEHANSCRVMQIMSSGYRT